MATTRRVPVLLRHSVSRQSGMLVSLPRWYVSSSVKQLNDANCQMWLGNNKKVYILDKTENNPVSITGKFGTHPAWAVEYDIASNTCTSGFIDTLDVADQQTVRWMSFPTLSVLVVLSLVTVPGPSLVATSVSTSCLLPGFC
jgi:hypothetical protein